MPVSCLLFLKSSIFDRPHEWNPVLYQHLPSRYVGSDEISVAIAKLWRTTRQKRLTYKLKLRMKMFLETEAFSDFNISITGSSTNGYGCDNADVDMILEVRNPKFTVF